MKLSRLTIILGFVVIGVLSRLIPHPPNFTAMNALALFGAFYISRPSLAVGVVFSTLLISDFVIGNHSTLPFVYGSFLLIMLVGYSLRNKLSGSKMLFVNAATSLLFFLVTNFGSWVTNAMYPKTVQGLVLCYTAALPFLTYQFVGDMLYGALFVSLFFGMRQVSDLNSAITETSFIK